MKWNVSIEKMQFLDWAKKASKDELQEYVVERKYPSTRRGIFLRVLSYVLLCILYMIFSFALVGLTGFFLVSGAFQEYVDDTVERNNNMGESVCADLGGFIKYGYTGDSVYFQCGDKFVMFDGSPMGCNP